MPGSGMLSMHPCPVCGEPHQECAGDVEYGPDPVTVTDIDDDGNIVAIPYNEVTP